MDLTKNFEQRFQNLNPSQKEAVNSIDGPVLTIAGPGSGKTEILSVRIANILKNTDALPSSILCLTFTDNASINMRRRLVSLMGREAYKIAIHTFHSFGTEIIGQYPEYFYESSAFNPADEIKQREILEKIIEKLNHKSELKKTDPDKSYIYMDDIIRRIDDLKKAGISSSEFLAIIKANQEFFENTAPLIAELFTQTVSKKQFPHYGRILTELKNLMKDSAFQSFGTEPQNSATSSQSPNPATSSQSQNSATSSQSQNSGTSSQPQNPAPAPAPALAPAPAPQSSSSDTKTHIEATYLQSFAQALAKAEQENTTKPVTEWKNKFLTKNEKNIFIFKDHKNLNKMLDLGTVYEEYVKQTRLLGYFDFADMIMETINAMEKFPELKFNLQEKYQYVLVDEFQDTNGVQMKLLEHLTDAEVNEGRPNIMAVGDDDQAIYKFQGAQLENITGFTEKFKDPALIVMENNYRSTQNIMDFARELILQGSERLESLMPDQIKKDLKAVNPNIKEGEILELEFDQEFKEYLWIAEKIMEMQKSGEDISDIGIICRKHKHLEDLAKILDMKGIPVAYKRKNNLLEDEHIREIITIIEYINTICGKSKVIADELLPEILTFPFLQIERLDIWKISLKASREKKLWLEIMLESENEKIKSFANFLIELGAKAKNTPLEHLFDNITGIQELKEYKSPYHEYYFKIKNSEKDSNKYLELLFGLKELIKIIRGFDGENTLKAKEFIEYIERVKKHKIKLELERDINFGSKAVQLNTVHGVKGLEFKTVFIVNCTETCWFKASGNDKLKFPKNLSLSSDSDNEDDKLRLFYVAVTRAKSNLYMTWAKKSEKNREQVKIRFLKPESRKKEINGEEMKEIILMKSRLHDYEIQNRDEKDFLKKVLEDYQLSATHLNSFLDLEYGGPQKFAEINLFKFPQALSKKNTYGKATHKALDDFYKEFKKYGILPTVEVLLTLYETALKNSILSETDYKELLEKGRENLGLFYNAHKNDFEINHNTEYDFKSEGVMVGKAPVTGKIDKMSFDRKSGIIKVFDYKTGKSFRTWEGRTSSAKAKLEKYKRQLVFYKILVEESRTFGGKYKVNEGALEFIDPDSLDEINSLSLNIYEKDVEYMKKLITAVYQRIINLDFPDTSAYSKDYKGMKAFEEALLGG